MSPNDHCTHTFLLFVLAHQQDCLHPGRTTAKSQTLISELEAIRAERDQLILALDETEQSRNALDQRSLS